MENRTAEGVLHGLRRLADTQTAQLTDAQLLARFASARDDGAFTALLQRHGSLVYGVCRNILRHEQDAEDAFQATFLVLARRAGAIREQKALGSWLYRVAYRVAMKARAAAHRRQRREARAAKSGEDRPVGDLAWRELQGMLDEELNRLPEKYRAPFVLCCLAGKSKAEAAAELGWKEGTVSSRLAQARERLKTRLARRGVALSAVLSGLAVAPPSTSAIVPAALLAATRQAALAFAAGGRLAANIATAPANLARAVLRGMVVGRFKLPAVILVVLGLAGAAVVTLARGAPRPPDHPPAPPAAADARGGGAQVATIDPAVDGLRQLVVRGRVVGADGKAVPRADIAILADEDRPAGDRDFTVFQRRRVVATGKADGEGKFEFVTARPVVRLSETRICLARGEGQAVNWKTLQTLVPVPPLELKLETGQQLRGRLVDEAGQPAAGVTLRFGGFHRSPEYLPAVAEGVAAPAWPPPIVTDADGRFVLTGVLRRAKVFLEIQDERYGPHWLTLTANDTDQTDAGTIRLPAPRVLEGTVVAADTLAPLAGATVVVRSFSAGASSVPARVIAQTDGTGRFRVRPYPGDSLIVTAAGPLGTPFLATQKSVQWPAGASSHDLDVRLPRGVLVRGLVAEQGSGLPVAGARIQYRPLSGRNRNGDKGNLLVLWPWLDAPSDANGHFELPVLPGPGHLLVRGPGHDWVPVEVSEDELIYGKRGSSRPHFPDALVPLDLKAPVAPGPVVATLRRGVTLRGRVETADGKPVAAGFLVSRTYLGGGWERPCEFLPVRDGRFEIPGCDPAGSETYWFWDHKALQGAAVELSADEQGRTVRLAPFGSASVRFVDPKGEMVRDLTPLNPHVYLVVRPGRSIWDKPGDDRPARLTQDANFQGLHIDPATGVITAKALVPGASYVIETSTGRGSQPFSVRAGENARLPDVVIDPPPKTKSR